MTFEKVLGLANFVLLALTAVFYWRQLNAMQIQIIAASLASKTHNFLSLVNLIQAEHVRKARDVVINDLKNRHFSEWTMGEQYQAGVVAASYDLVGVVVKEGYVSETVVLENWGPSIKECHAALSEFIRNRRVSHGPKYWNDFDELCDKAKFH